MPDVDDRLTAAHVAYLGTQMLGRLATVDPDGKPQNNPVGFRYNAELGTIDIDGLDMGRSRKFRNLATNPNVALVVDDIVSVRPWRSAAWRSAARPRRSSNSRRAGTRPPARSSGSTRRGSSRSASTLSASSADSVTALDPRS